MNQTEAVQVRAPGKVNLSLRVDPPRADGYHPLETVFMAVGLYEEVTASRNPAGTGITVTVTGLQADHVPLDASNIAVQAAAALAAHAGIAPDVHLHIDKGVPVAGGMAGGSADAAATLVACDTLWGLAMSRTELASIGSALGADVPFCLLGGTAVGRGIGDLLTPVMSRGDFYWAFATQTDGLSTPTVFTAFDTIVDRIGIDTVREQLADQRDARAHAAKPALASVHGTTDSGQLSTVAPLRTGGEAGVSGVVAGGVGGEAGASSDGGGAVVNGTAVVDELAARRAKNAGQGHMFDDDGGQVVGADVSGSVVGGWTDGSGAGVDVAEAGADDGVNGDVAGGSAASGGDGATDPHDELAARRARIAAKGRVARTGAASSDTMPPIAADGRPPQPTPLPPRPGTGQIPLPASIDNGEGALLQALRFGDTEGVGAALNNDLEAAALALRPDLARVLDIAHSAHALGVIVSGSGPTVAALARTERHARTIAATWTAEDAADHVWVAAGPTQGARIIG